MWNEAIILASPQASDPAGCRHMSEPSGTRHAQTITAELPSQLVDS